MSDCRLLLFDVSESSSEGLLSLRDMYQSVEISVGNNCSWACFTRRLGGGELLMTHLESWVFCLCAVGWNTPTVPVWWTVSFSVHVSTCRYFRGTRHVLDVNMPQWPASSLLCVFKHYPVGYALAVLLVLQRGHRVCCE